MLMPWELVKFCLFLLLACYLPGRLIVNNFKDRLSRSEVIVISLVTGILGVTILALVLGFLKLRILLLPTLLGIDLYLVVVKKWRPDWSISKKIDFWAIGVVILGSLTQAGYLLKSGWQLKNGIGFWGVNGYDGIWHTSLIAELSRGFPPQNPGFAGQMLMNYHFLTDLFLAQIHYFTRIDILNLYFRFSPLFFAFLLNSLVFLFALRWSKKRSVAFLSVFFVSLAGSLGWILPFFGKGSNNWETAFWGIQTPSSLVNPPFAVSLVLILTTLILIDVYLKQKSKYLALTIAIFLGALVGFKVYGAVVFLAGLGLLGSWELIRKKDASWLGMTLTGFLIALFFYLPFTRGTQDFLIWKPWWFIRTMIEAGDRVNWPMLELRRQVYASFGNILGLLRVESLAFLIFLFGNLSARSLGFLVWPQKILKGNFLDRYLIICSLLAFLPPLFFIQKGVAWNTIQFIYYFTFLFSFFAAETVGQLFSSIKSKTIIWLTVIFLVAVSLPSTIETLYWHNSPVPTTLLSNEEISALGFLKNNSRKSDLILTYPYGGITSRNFPQPPVPMTYYNSAYVSFFADRRVYLEDQNSANILGYPLEERLTKEKEFFQTENPQFAGDFLEKEKIAYIYLVGDQKIKTEKNLPLEKVFENQSVEIYRVGDKI